MTGYDSQSQSTRPSQDLTIAGLKIQNCIMDEGLDLHRAHELEDPNSCNARLHRSVKVGRITAMVQTTTTTTLEPQLSLPKGINSASTALVSLRALG